jgi:hypothetical protein
MSEHDNEGENKPLKIVFAEGCFDDFEGTQEELDELIVQLTTMAEDGSLLEKSVSVDIEDIDEEVLELLPMLTSGNVRH